MAYTLNKSDGESIIVSDGTVDTNSTSLVLIGKNYAGYGTFLNDNFIHLLENFSNSTSPANPLKGQLWWDTNNNILKVYSGSSWKISTGATSSPFSSPPGDLSALGGDLWYDTTNSQLKVYSGTGWITVGPTAVSALQTTGAFAAQVTDSSGGTHKVVQLQFNGVVYAMFAYETFATSIPGFTTIKAGLNFNTTNTPAWQLSNQDVNATAGTIVQRDGSAGITAGAITGTSLNVSGTITGTNFAGSFAGNLAGNVSATTVSATTVSASGVSASAGYTGTVLTANQPNITTLGNLGRLQVNGTSGNNNIVGTTVITGLALYNGAEIATVGGGGGTVNLGGSAIIGSPIGTLTDRSTGFFTTINVQGIVPSANLVYDIGSSTARFGNVWAATFRGTSVQAQYADLAERFHADAEYPAGTVVEMGGVNEITKVVEELSNKVFGVISTNAAYLMNSAAGNDATHPPIAMSGRVPVRVVGLISKGDRLVSAGNGVARAGKTEELTPWNVIGRSLVNKTDPAEDLIEAIVKINS